MNSHSASTVLYINVIVKDKINGLEYGSTSTDVEKSTEENSNVKIKISWNVDTIMDMVMNTVSRFNMKNMC